MSKFDAAIKMLTKKILEGLYIGEQKSCREIGNLYGVEESSIRRRMVKWNIPRREEAGKNNLLAYLKNHKGKLSGTWAGGRYQGCDGYQKIFIGNDRYMPEQRIVAEKALGRPLKKNEVVHHINCDRSDNRNEKMRVKVTNLENGKSIIVPITDRGPFIGERILDLSEAAFRVIAPLKHGLIRVQITPMSVDMPRASKGD
jgi:hypothetical protein